MRAERTGDPRRDANWSRSARLTRFLRASCTTPWREAGFGLGHTFPGSTVPGSDRPKIGGWYVPRWLARIDYIFFSDDWTAVEVRTAQIDGVSDHRGAVAVLELK